MSKHTPGPWFVINCGDDDEPMYSVKAARIHGQKPGHEVALCATGDSPQEMETANAHLIAAAPDMFALLKLFLHEHDQTYDGEPLSPEMLAFIEGTRLAIAKVEAHQ